MDVRAKNRGCPHQSAFFCGPGDGEKLFDPGSSGRKGQECPREIRTKKFMFMLLFSSLKRQGFRTQESGSCEWGSCRKGGFSAIVAELRSLCEEREFLPKIDTSLAIATPFEDKSI